MAGDEGDEPRIGPFDLQVPAPSPNGSRVEEHSPLDSLRTAAPGLAVGLLLALSTVPSRPASHGAAPDRRTASLWIVHGMEWNGHEIRVLDQTRLPRQETWLTLATTAQLARAIKAMRIRGAPALGIAGAYGVAQAA